MINKPRRPQLNSSNNRDVRVTENALKLLLDVRSFVISHKLRATPHVFDLKEAI